MKPFKAIPALKERIWGGQRLKQYNKSFEGINIGESWETDKDTMPVLVKLIDANDILSVQVHPNDSLAWELEKQSFGKTEAWIVLDCIENAELVAGIKRGTTQKQLEQAIREGCLEKLLNIIRVRKGDCIYIPAGTVHSLGKGMLVYEVQQPSDLTYRLYDWNRTDGTGRPRELHIDKALQSIDYNISEVTVKNLHEMKLKPGYDNIIFDNQYFTTSYIVLKKGQRFSVTGSSFSAVTITSGCAIAAFEKEHEEMLRGDTWIVPKDTVLTIVADCDCELILTTKVF